MTASPLCRTASCTLFSRASKASNCSVTALLSRHECNRWAHPPGPSGEVLKGRAFFFGGAPWRAATSPSWPSWATSHQRRGCCDLASPLMSAMVRCDAHLHCCSTARSGVAAANWKCCVFCTPETHLWLWICFWELAIALCSVDAGNSAMMVCAANGNVDFFNTLHAHFLNHTNKV